MPTKLRRLKAEALESCEFREHRMKRFENYGLYESAFSECINCGMWVLVVEKPMPNEIEISGQAVALTCTGDRHAQS